MIKQQIKFYQDGSEVSRYHTVRTIQSESVGHHSHGVIMFCILLGYHSSSILQAAAFHDLAEHVTGDLPSPSKKAYGIGEQVNELESRLLSTVKFDVEITGDEKRALKLADIFQGLSFSLSEVRLGNQRMQIVAERYAGYAEDLILVGKEREVCNAIWELHNESK